MASRERMRKVGFSLTRSRPVELTRFSGVLIFPRRYGEFH